MRTSHYDNNLINLQFSIENNIEKWGVLPTSACNHIYSQLTKEGRKKEEDVDIQSTDEQENSVYIYPKDIDEELDVPGADLDDLQEDVGSEDEENNYYSIGGDNHNDLEENGSN